MHHLSLFTDENQICIHNGIFRDTRRKHVLISTAMGFSLVAVFGSRELDYSGAGPMVCWCRCIFFVLFIPVRRYWLLELLVQLCSKRWKWIWLIWSLH